MWAVTRHADPPNYERSFTAPGAFEVKLPLPHAVTMTEVVQDWYV